MQVQSESGVYFPPMGQFTSETAGKEQPWSCLCWRCRGGRRLRLVSHDHEIIRVPSRQLREKEDAITFILLVALSCTK